jgi:hypothetical protein
VVQETLVDRSCRNVLLLALCQAAFISTAALIATIGTLAGHTLAADKALATLPATAITVGTALGAIPASLIMRHVERRLGFILGSSFTMAGGLVGAWADLDDGRGDRAFVRAAAAPAWLERGPRDRGPAAGFGSRIAPRRIDQRADGLPVDARGLSTAARGEVGIRPVDRRTEGWRRCQAPTRL